jgi:hypothetical protein
VNEEFLKPIKFKYKAVRIYGRLLYDMPNNLFDSLDEFFARDLEILDGISDACYWKIDGDSW